MTRRFLVVVLTTLIAAATAVAQQQTGSIKGVVMDDTGAALPGATLTLSGPASRTAVSGGDGSFKFDRLPAGTYKVTVVMSGFGTQEQANVSVSGGTTTEVPFKMPVVLRGEDVIVSASKVETALVDAPATVSVISSDSIAAAPAQNFGDLLRSVPGLNVIQTSSRDFNLTARQATSTLSNSQLALLDGRSIYLDFFGMILWDFVPTNPAEIKQIEVLRGPASAVWGANALTGVVNIITKTPREAPGGSVTLSGGTFDRECDHCSETGSGQSFGVAASYARAASDKLSYKIAAGYYNADPYSRPTGRVPKIQDPRDPSKTVGGASYPLDGPPSASNPFGSTFQNSGTSQPKVELRIDQELSSGGRITYSGGYAGTEGIVHTGIGPFDIQSGSYMAYGKVGYAKGAFKLNLFGNFVNADAPNLMGADPATLKPIQLNFSTQTFDLELGNSNVISQQLILTYGGNARRNNFDITLAPNAEDRNEFGGYLQAEAFVGKFRFNVGGRVDKFGNLDKAVFSPRLAVLYKPAKSHALRVSFNKAFRSPSTINNYLNQGIFSPVDLSALAPLLPAPLRPALARPFPLAVYAVGSEVPINGRAQQALKEQSLTAYEIGYTGTISGKTTLSAAFYINDNGRDINFSRLDPKTDPYTPLNPPPGWNSLFGPAGPIIGPVILGAIGQRGIFLPRTAYTYLNLGPTRQKGFELGIDHAFNKEWSAFFNFSHQPKPEIRPKKESDVPEFPKGELAFAARNRYNMGIHWDSRRFLATALLNHSEEAFWSDVLTDDYSGYTDAYDMLNATFGMKFNQGKIVASVKGNNLLNQDIQQHVFGDVMKRSLMAEVRFTF